MVKKEDVIEKLKTVYDPELNLDIWTLGLVYDINISNSTINIKMTFTFPGCPYGPLLLDNVKKEVSTIKDIKIVNIELTFNPPWQPSQELKEMLGL
ncbi:metal-sulfur cluster assembly factor [Candidatus Woesearchaeota archaeon]|nr:metal-sulfur cluster assembly factor [Candidatus Woesearchaeota archaeon]